jgi:hypothetical protein
LLALGLQTSQRWFAARQAPEQNQFNVLRKTFTIVGEGFFMTG